MAPLSSKVRRPPSNADIASNMSSEFEEVHLEEVEHSTSTGSGEEVEWTPSGDDEVMQAKGIAPSSAVVGKNVPVPRLASLPTKAPDTAPLQQAASRTTPANDDGQQAGPSTTQQGLQDDEEPLLSWRGTRTGPAPNTVNELGEPVYDPLKDFELATQKAAELASQAAKNVSTKILGGAAEAKKSISNMAHDVQAWQIMHGAADAKDTLKSLANNVSSWWANLDPVQKPASPGRPTSTMPSAQGGRNDFHNIFGLPEEEDLMENFQCQLVQTYSCSQNSFSKPQQLYFAGTLYITDKHTCFAAPADNICFTISHSSTKQANKVSMKGKKTGSVEGLLLTFGEKESVVFQEFKGADLNSALALLEHLTADG